MSSSLDKFRFILSLSLINVYSIVASEHQTKDKSGAVEESQYNKMLLFDIFLVSFVFSCVATVFYHRRPAIFTGAFFSRRADPQAVVQTIVTCHIPYTRKFHNGKNIENNSCTDELHNGKNIENNRAVANRASGSLLPPMPVNPYGSIDRLPKCQYLNDQGPLLVRTAF